MSAAYRRRRIGEAIRRYTVEEIEGKHRVRDSKSGLLIADQAGPLQYDTAALAQAKAIDLAAAEIELVFIGEVRA